MRVLPLALAAAGLILPSVTHAQPEERTHPAEEAAVATDTAESEGQPIALVPVLSAPLEPIATGAPVRLEPYKPAAAPRRPLPPSQPAAQARPR